MRVMRVVRRRRGPGRRLMDRLPVPLRQHWRPAAAFLAGLTVLVVVFGDARVAPYVTSASETEADEITQTIEGTVGLYDASIAHTVELDYTQDDFERMMREFREEGTKEFIRADLTIDGTVVEDVGIRLKGNSTLMGLRDTGSGGLPGGAAGGDAPAFPGGQAPNGAGGGAGGGQEQGGGMPGGLMAYDLSADRPEELPWLVKIDEYIEGRTYQGHREISLRPGSDEQVPLNEALSLTLIESSGQSAEAYAFTTVTVNDRPTVTRLMVENPSTDYATNTLGGDGVLYRARAGGSFEYVGDDPTDYEESFEQLNKEGSQDLGPLIRLIRWADQATDEEFARELEDYVDVESLATYVATQNLLLNFDDMAGPGKNYLLWYDLETRRFSVLGWDYNLTFSGAADTGPDDDLAMGGMMPGGGEGGSSEGMPEEMPEGIPEGGMPEGMQLPEGMEIPEGGGQAPEGMGGGGEMMMGHALKDRFLEEESFSSLYHSVYADLYQQLYVSGRALRALEEITAQAQQAGADQAGVEAAARELRTTVTERTEALAADEAVTG
jgi:spore coat protein CotH